MPLGVSVVNTSPVYLTDERGNPLAATLPSGLASYGIPVVVQGFDELGLAPLTDALAGIRAMLGGPTAGVPTFPTATVLADADTAITATKLGAVIYGWDGTNYKRIATRTATDALTNGQQLLYVGAFPSGYIGSGWDRLRTPATFKTAAVTGSGDNALWTPAAGKKFRLLRVIAYVTQDAILGAGADLTIALRDNVTAINVTWSVYVPALAATTLGEGWTSGWIDLGNGILSAAANNVLNVNLSAAITGGTCRVIACGTEE